VRTRRIFTEGAILTEGEVSFQASPESLFGRRKKLTFFTWISLEKRGIRYCSLFQATMAVLRP
jgi:hypothetical protein